MLIHKYKRSKAHRDVLIGAWLELLLLSEEHREAYDGPVDQQTADNAHSHSLGPDLVSVCEYNR